MSRSAQVKRRADGAEGTITVSRTVFNQITEEREHISIRPFATDTARVSVKFGRTINLGNYESARVDVMFDMPCYVEEASRVYKDVLELAEARLSEEVSKITGQLSPEQSVEELL